MASAQAAINGPEPFEASFAFAEGLDSSELTIISGTPDVAYAALESAFGAFNVEAFSINDLTMACWNLQQYQSSGQQDGDGCATSASGQISIRTVNNGSVAYNFPVAVTGQYTADHALTYPIDFAFQDELKEMGIGESLLLSAVDGLVRTDKVPVFQGTGLVRGSYGSIAPITEDTVFEVVRDGNVIHTTGSNQQFLAFESTVGLTIAPYQTDFALIPFENGSVATFAPADKDAAREGFNLTRLQGNIDNLSDASGSGADELPEGLDGAQTLLSEILDGGIVHVNSDAGEAKDVLEEGALIRFSEMTLSNTGTSGDLAWQGQASLQVRNGEVAGADKLIFLFPWWSFLLWGLAIVAIVFRVVRKQPKDGPLDKFAWIGWVGGILASLLVFYLWDLEVREVWGTSLLSTNAGFTGMAAVALLQLLPWAIVGIAVTLPLRLIGTNVVHAAGLGKGARLTAILMPIFGFLLGATLLLDFLGVLLENAVERL